MVDFDGTVPGAEFSPLSQRSSAGLPNRRVFSSVDAGWRSMLLELHENDGQSGPFDVMPTEDQTIVVAVKGSHRLDVCRGGRWRSTMRHAGSVGTARAGETCRLRVCGGSRPRPFQTAHLYVPPAALLELADEYRRAGQRVDLDRLSSLLPPNGVMQQTAIALVQAARAGAGELYARTARQWIALYLLAAASGIDPGSLRARGAGVLSDRRLARAVDAMRGRLGEDFTLEWLAAEAGVSKFHFVRLFRQATGQTPWEYLTDLRLQHGRHLLETTDHSIADIARSCGYARATSFGTAFASHFATTPGAFRRRDADG